MIFEILRGRVQIDIRFIRSLEGHMNDSSLALAMLDFIFAGLKYPAMP